MVDAVRALIEVQNSMVLSAMPVIRAGLEFRIGIHLGDVVEESDGDLMGDGVTIAARKRQPRKEPGKANNLPLVRKVSLSAV